jgi:hypothetical protein
MIYSAILPLVITCGCVNIEEVGSNVTCPDEDHEPKIGKHDPNEKGKWIFVNEGIRITEHSIRHGNREVRIHMKCLFGMCGANICFTIGLYGLLRSGSSEGKWERIETFEKQAEPLNARTGYVGVLECKFSEDLVSRSGSKFKDYCLGLSILERGSRRFYYTELRLESMMNRWEQELKDERWKRWVPGYGHRISGPIPNPRVGRSDELGINSFGGVVFDRKEKNNFWSSESNEDDIWSTPKKRRYNSGDGYMIRTGYLFIAIFYFYIYG